MVDLGGYVIILVETQDKRVKLYGKFDMQRNIAEWFFRILFIHLMVALCMTIRFQNINQTRSLANGLIWK